MANSDGDSLDGRVCALWDERGVPGCSGNVDRLGPVSDIHDHDRNVVWTFDSRVERRLTECDGIAGSGHGGVDRSDSASVI
ncbi:MAG: hypothetical protein QOE55_8236 [Acidobacteriaceae bacterium]|nr:hypothetical protein [Acidobacteriaceae bacterium]